MTAQHDRVEIIEMHQHHEETTHRCHICDGSGWKDVKSPDDTPSYDYCSCIHGRRKRREAQHRAEQERRQEAGADLPW